MRRTLISLALLATIACWSACGGGNSNTSANASRDEVESTVNSERIESSNIAPTGGPGAEPENGGTKPSGNTNESKTENKNKTDNKNKNTP
jgi:hypothetical protein